MTSATTNNSSNNPPTAQPQTPAVSATIPQTPAVVHPASPPSRRDLKSWWKGFKLPSKHQEAHEVRPQGIFGVPLRQSITYANVAISLIDENGKSYIYGYVPIVVAKCGVFLKEKATGIEGIFRLSGSEKRIKELKLAFDSPDRYGKGLVWDGYTVHDAANVLRRYLNDLPEPVVPLDLYEKFRDPLRGATKQAVGDTEGPQLVDKFDMEGAISKYQRLITELPPLNKQLLLYILDLLAVFAAKSDENRMNSQNLAAIFQPGMLSHPNHAMAPEEYRLNQCVIIFLIENQDHFLIGMQGTAADEKTVREVQKGTPAVVTPSTPTSLRKSGIVRSASNASAGAESVARDGKIRRNRSVSSRHSRQSNGAPSPGSPAHATTPTSGLGRSNTLPSKKSPNLAAGRFAKRPDQTSSPVAPLTPIAAQPTPATPTVHEVIDPEHDTVYGQASLSPAAAGAANILATQAGMPPKTEGFLEPTPAVETATPSKERRLPSLFQRSPASDGDTRQPNKLRKKRLPGSANPSAQSSTASLNPSPMASPPHEIRNPMENLPSVGLEGSSVNAPTSAPAAPNVPPLVTHAAAPAVGPTIPEEHSATDTPSEVTPRASELPSAAIISSASPENMLNPQQSHPTSLNSSFNEGSDFDTLDEVAAGTAQPDAEREKKRRWRLSRRKEESQHAGPSSSSLGSPPREVLGSNRNAEISTSSVGSSGNRAQRSSTAESSEPTAGTTVSQSVHESTKENREESRNFIGRLRDKYREVKENHDRHKSPPGDRSAAVGTILPSRAKSPDPKQQTVEEEKAVAPTETKEAPQ